MNTLRNPQSGPWAAIDAHEKVAPAWVAARQAAYKRWVAEYEAALYHWEAINHQARWEGYDECVWNIRHALDELVSTQHVGRVMGYLEQYTKEKA